MGCNILNPGQAVKRRNAPVKITSASGRRYQGIRGYLDCRRVELSTNMTLARSRWTSNYYITPATGSSDQLERRCWSENHVPAEAEPPGPRLSSPEGTGENAAVARRVGGLYVAVLFSLQLTSHR